MNWIPHFSSWQYAVAGLVCATGPVLIHLLNRRRFRSLDWAAMDFLREALQRERRVLRLRDLILLALRTAAVLLFALALARPYLVSQNAPIHSGGPRHLILLIDNSLSMSFRPLDQSLLDAAKQEARRLISILPEGSRISVIDICRHRSQQGEPWRRKIDAIESAESIQETDRPARIEEALTAARQALRAAAPLPDQVVLITDMQRLNWPPESAQPLFADLPTIGIRDVGSTGGSNTWVESISVRDGLADRTTPASILVSVRHQGAKARRLQVTLSIDQQRVATRTLEMPAGQSRRQITFEHVFADVSLEPGVPTFVPATASITADQLPTDDRRTVMVPVVADVPIVFVDGVTDDAEDPAAGRLGETRPLRQLLAAAPETAGGRPLIEVRHVTVDQLNRDLLAAARLVVMAGVADPGDAVALLQEFVAQGGPLVIATGAAFDPQAWNRRAWKEGPRLLPAPLLEVPVGAAPDDESGQLVPFVLDFDSLASEPLLRLPGLSEDELRDVYREPLFFKAIAVDLAATAERESGRSPPGENRGDVSSAWVADVAANRWLTWKPPPAWPRPSGTNAQPVGTTAAATSGQCDVCARFADRRSTPFLVRKRIGAGQVLFAATGLLPEWNNLAQTNAIVIWDQLLRRLLRGTFPSENYRPQEQIDIPLYVADRVAAVQLQRPDRESSSEFTEAGFVGREQYGVSLRDVWTRGIYRISGYERDVRGEVQLEAPPKWVKLIAVNGEPDESDLTTLSVEERARILDDGHAAVMSAGSSWDSLADETPGQSYWRWLVIATFATLTVELLLLAVWRV